MADRAAARILSAARKHIESGWISDAGQEIGARTSTGRIVAPDNPDAVEFSTGGALLRASHDHGASGMMSAAGVLEFVSSRVVWHQDVADTKPEVLAVFDRAIALARPAA